MMPKELKQKDSRSELIMVSSTIGILLILFIPITASLLDFLLIMNFSWALTVLLLTFYTDKPLSFSTFPALLLLSTLFRLALNISATRLILAEGEAGKVIQAMGLYVIQGNYVMGLVVFLILIIIQFIVITNGAQRVAEVAARFTLDSMPGKQMSIDADLNMGIISQAEAKVRRGQIEKEANFYGAMDGASKFVKGDAIAGILIILVDIIGGFAIGLLEKGLSFSESLQRYTLLTVGDGLVTQIPALIISTATGIIVTRAATDSQLGREIARQIAAYPKTLLMVSGALLGLLNLKGFPLIPVALILSGFGIAAWFASRSKTKQETSTLNEINLYEKIRIYPIEIQLNDELFNQFLTHETSFLEMVQQLRERLAYEFGFVIPEVKVLSDRTIQFPFYQISIQGNGQGFNQLHLDKLLAIRSKQTKERLFSQVIEVRDPSYGLPALWIAVQESNLAIEAGYTLCDPLNVMTTHLKEIVHIHLAQLLNRMEVEQLMDQPALRNLRDELVPALLPLGQVQGILQGLLEEKVSIRPLSMILEVLLEHAKQNNDPIQLAEIVRSHLGKSICQKLIGKQVSLEVLTLAPQLEQKLNQGLGKEHLALEPSVSEAFISALAKQVEKMLTERKRPILLCSSMIRRPIRLLTQRVIPHLTILAMNEVPMNIQVESFAVVQ